MSHLIKKALRLLVIVITTPLIVLSLTFCFLFFYIGIDLKGEITDYFETHKKIKELTERIEENPNDYEALNARSSIYNRLGKTEKAESDRKKFMNLNLDDPWYYFLRSFIHKGHANILKDFKQDEAKVNEYMNRCMDDINRAIELSPENSYFYYIRSDKYSYIEEYDKALADINKSIDLLNPEKVPYYLFTHRAWIFLNINEYGKAISDLNRCLIIQFDESSFRQRANVYYERAKKFDEVGKVKEAIESYKKYLEHDLMSEFDFAVRKRKEFALKRISVLEESM